MSRTLADFRLAWEAVTSLEAFEVTRRFILVLAALVALVLASLAVVPAQASQAELDLLKAYIGGWSGAGGNG